MKSMLRVFFLLLLCVPLLSQAQCDTELWSDFSFQKVSGCMPVKYKFTDMSTACSTTITDWYWEFGDGTTSNAQNPEHDFTSQAQFNVKLTITDNLGNSIRRSKRLTVIPSTLTVDLGPDTTICFGSNLHLDAGIAGAAYAWSTGENTQAIDVNDDGDYIVTVQTPGCTAKDTIRVNTSASVSNKWSYSTGEACLPVQVSFVDSSEAYCGQAIRSWFWDFGDGTFSDDQNPVHGFTSADTFIVRLMVTTTAGVSSTTTKKVNIQNTLHEVIIPSQVKVCTGEEVLIDAGVDSADYTWGPSFGVSDIKQKNATIKPIMNTWYYVDVLKCMVNVRDSVYVIVDSISKPQVVQEENQLVAPSGFTYEWYLNGNKINGAISQRLRIGRQGYYAVKVYNESGCSRLSDEKFVLPVSGKEKSLGNIRVKCTPNPGTGRFEVVLSDLPEVAPVLRVYDHFGRIVKAAVIKGNITLIDITGLAGGIYYMVVTINNSNKIIPVVLQQ